MLLIDIFIKTLNLLRNLSGNRGKDGLRKTYKGVTPKGYVVWFTKGMILKCLSYGFQKHNFFWYYIVCRGIMQISMVRQVPKLAF